MSRTKVAHFMSAATVLSVVLAAGASASAQTAAAQTPIAQPASSDQPPVEPAAALSELTVTATRVDRKGFFAPTPTVVLNEGDLFVGGHTNIIDVIGDLPQETSAWGGNNGTSDTGNLIGGVGLGDLRDLGPDRTLVLIDGARPVTTEFSGTTLGFDLSMIPLALVKKVDVVTGGASASWGSDAIAGVINIIMDDGFTGVKADAQYGRPTDGLSGSTYRFDLAGGVNFANDRAHIMAGVGYEFQPQIGPRDANVAGQYGLISNPAYTPANGQPQDLFVRNVNFSSANIGGLIVSGPLKGTDFGPGGSIGTFVYGADAGPTFMSGGDSSAYKVNDGEAIAEPLQRENFYARGSYDVNRNVAFTADLLLGHTYTNARAFDNYNLGNISISVNNPYLPATIKSQMLADHISTIALGRIDSEFPEYGAIDEAYVEQLKIGAHGTTSNGWSWDAFASYGATERSVKAGPQEITANFANSVNVVASPTTGQPVCAIALTNPATNCVPVNLFGPGAASSAAQAYFIGTSVLHMGFTQTEVAANLRGTPVATWAGPVSVALGLEFRDEAVTAHTDAITSANGFSFFNAGTLTDGSYQVGEGYIEVVAPLVRNAPLLQSVDFDGGVRASDYSTTGFVPSWKVGLSDQMTDEIRLRGEYSRDIRAPNLAELYLKRSSGYTNIVDPSDNVTTLAATYGGGNTSLKPEIAYTGTLGFIYSPKWLNPLSISIDYYNIDIQNAISTLTAQVLVNECFNNVSSACSQITRAGGAITSVSATEINIASYDLSGFDLEAEYHTDLAALNLPGSLNVRAVATYIDTLKENTGAAVVNLAGDVTNGSPRVRGSVTANYTVGPLQFLARARYVEGGAYSKQITVNATVPAATYFDLGVQYKIPGHESYVLYADIDNIGNSLNALNNNPIYYDVLGTIYDVGIRVRF